MGSAGSGRFGTYRIDGGEGTSMGGKDGAGNGETKCPEILKNIRLEDVALSEYYLNYSSLPGQGTAIKLRPTIYRGRLVVETIENAEILGNLPTQYNYLVNCIRKGMKYSGEVIASGITPVPFVVVTLHA